MSPKVRVAIGFIGDNLHRDIYVNELARWVRLSQSRLSHIFKSELGMSVIQYVKTARLEKARQLLETTLEPIKAVAFQVGYRDPTRFERDFKRAHGLSPSRYRLECRPDDDDRNVGKNTERFR